MAGGHNKSFLQDPVAFLNANRFTVRDQAMTTGLQRVQFSAGNPIELAPFTGLAGPFQHPFEAYFLKALPNNRNFGVGFPRTGANFLFTSTLNGCQFIAWGMSKHTLNIEHNNALQLGQPQYDQHNNDVPNDAAMRLRVHNGGQYDVANGDIGNIVGIRGANGWDIYWQHITVGQGGFAINVQQLL